MASDVNELLDMLFEMIEEAKSVPLSSDKCMVDRSDALDRIDEIRSAFPMELAEAKKLLAARNDYLASAKREGDLLIQQAEERAKQMLAENELLAKAKQEQGCAPGWMFLQRLTLQNRPDQLQAGQQHHHRRNVIKKSSGPGVNLNEHLLGQGQKQEGTEQQAG